MLLQSKIISRHQVAPKQERTKVRPPTAPHNRPSSPGLKGKTIIPTYTASLQSKPYTVTALSKIKGISTAAKGKSLRPSMTTTSDSKVSPFLKQAYRPWN